MSYSDVIELSSDDKDTREAEINDVKPIILSHYDKDIKEYFMDSNILEQKSYGSHLPNDIYQANRTNDSGRDVSNAVALQNTSFLCRQFWKSGDFEAVPTLAAVSGKNRLRIHPKFLHSNATSHKWAFGAIAELLDNAVDEVHNGATFVVVDKFTNPRNGEAALLIQDDGGGMDPESIRRCMSFGFSDKQSRSAIGQYGNGFKTSTMRLGADAVVLSRHRSERTTQSIGLLSYTFLRKTGSDDIVVPVVDYEFDQSTGVYARRLRGDEKQFLTNLSTILSWSPFSSESELFDQFDDIGHHGTKVIVFNIWYNDDGKMELDFETDPKDILINKTHRKQTPKKITVELTQKNIANRLQYSLRAYSSILYLRVPEGFKIILRGEVVLQHHVVNDLQYLECIVYRPHVEGYPEILTTVGFLKEAPNVDIHGFNVYHRNRLILPFWRVVSNSGGKGRGVVGVLEANFIKPTHDKQDFEKSSIYQKLENRLKEMTYEYWDLHCHIIGYKPSSKKALNVMGLVCSPAQQMVPNNPSQWELTEHNSVDQPGLAHKRKQENDWMLLKYLKKRAVAIKNAEGLHRDQEGKLELPNQNKQIQEMKIMLAENKKLREQCLELEGREKELMLKEEKLRRELRSFECLHQKLDIQLKALGEVKMEKL